MPQARPLAAGRHREQGELVSEHVLTWIRRHRSVLIAVVVGFAGVLLMVRPGGSQARDAAGLAILLLPMFAALAYALMQMMTRKLGLTASASAMAVYVQGTFILVSSAFWLVAGDGRFAEGQTSQSLIFLLRAWHWPEPADLALLALVGVLSSLVAYSLTQAYRIADAAVIAPFEYVALPLAILWGWIIWRELPDLQAAIGMLLIAGAGIYIFLREGAGKRRLASGRSDRRI